MSHIPANRIKGNNKVDLWDLGPSAPTEPKEPAKPDSALKGAEKAAAEVEYEDAIENYKDELRAWSAARKDRRNWNEEMGGPRKIELWGCDARHAMTVEPDRYKLDLPKNMKPGRAQVEAEAREMAEREARERDVANDPQFGSASQGAV